RHYPGMHLSSCIYGHIDVLNGTWSYCSAGHLPPLLVRAGQVSILPSPHGPPLGAAPAPVTYSTTSIDIQPGDVIVLYTDGLVERRSQDIETGIGRLAQHLSDLGPEENLFAASRQMVSQMTAGSPTADDIALVLLRRSTADSRR